MNPETVRGNARDEARQRGFVRVGDRRRPAVDHVLPYLAEARLVDAFQHQDELRPVGRLRAGLHIGGKALLRRGGGGVLAGRLDHLLLPALGEMPVSGEDQLLARGEVIEQTAARQLGSSITALVMPLSIPMWARYLDRSHVVQFRAKQTWMFVFSACVACAGVLFHRVELLYLTAVLQGISYGGGTLAWNLGHVDFAPPTHTSQYMASHVTLNGIRGLLAPFVAVGLYNGAFMAGFSVLGLDVTTTAAALVLAVSAVMCAIGAAGFGRLLTRMGDRATLAKARSA